METELIGEIYIPQINYEAKGAYKPYVAFDMRIKRTV